MSWSNDKKLSLEEDVIGWNYLKIYIKKEEDDTSTYQQEVFTSIIKTNYLGWNVIFLVDEMHNFITDYVIKILSLYGTCDLYFW